MTDVLIKYMYVIAYLTCRDPFILSVLTWRPEGFTKQNGKLLGVSTYCSNSEKVGARQSGAIPLFLLVSIFSRRLLRKVDEIQH